MSSESKGQLAPIVDMYSGDLKGAKSWQEDAHFTWKSKSERILIGGVFDGHGGLNGRVASQTARAEALKFLDHYGDVVERWSDKEWGMHLERLFETMHNVIRTKFVQNNEGRDRDGGDGCVYVDELGIVRDPDKHPIHGGSTGSIVVVILPAQRGSTSIRIISAYVGDSLSLMVKHNQQNKRGTPSIDATDVQTRDFHFKEQQEETGGTTEQTQNGDSMTGSKDHKEQTEVKPSYTDESTVKLKKPKIYEFLAEEHAPDNASEFLRIQSVDSKEMPVKLMCVYDLTSCSRKYDCPEVFHPNGEKVAKYVQDPWGLGLHPTNKRYEPAVYAVTPQCVSYDSTCIAMTRALGDFYATQFGLSHHPTITFRSWDLSSQGPLSFLVASDGVWDCWKYTHLAKQIRARCNTALSQCTREDTRRRGFGCGSVWGASVLRDSVSIAIESFGRSAYDDASLCAWYLCESMLLDIQDRIAESDMQSRVRTMSIEEQTGTEDGKQDPQGPAQEQGEQEQQQEQGGKGEGQEDVSDGTIDAVPMSTESGGRVRANSDVMVDDGT